MKNNIMITLNGMAIRNSRLFIKYLNSIMDTFVSTSVDLYDPCILWNKEGRIQIDIWGADILDELEENNIQYVEFNNVFQAYMYIRLTREHMRSDKGFEFNGTAVERIIPPYRRKPRRPETVTFDYSKYNLMSEDKRVLYSF